MFKWQGRRKAITSKMQFFTLSRRQSLYDRTLRGLRQLLVLVRISPFMSGYRQEVPCKPVCKTVTFFMHPKSTKSAETELSDQGSNSVNALLTQTDP